jgi:ATP-dependent DNA ligase I
VLLKDVVRTSGAVAASSGRRTKINEIAALLRRARPDEVPVVVSFLSGELPQRQIGVGYAVLGELLRLPLPGEGAVPDAPAGGQPSGAEAPAAEPSGAEPSGAGAAAAGPPGTVPAEMLTVAETDAVFTVVGQVRGPGAQAERRRLLTALMGRATAAERQFLVRLLAGELRQGALEGVMADAVAQAVGVPPGEVRRAHLLAGSLPRVAQAALAAAQAQNTATPAPPARLPETALPETAGLPETTGLPETVEPAAADASLAALRSFGLEVGRPLKPMLASSASTVAAALGRLPAAALDWKIDGIRVQVHRRGHEVRVFTRTLDDITARMPEITEAVLGLTVDSVVLDGEVVALDPPGRPRPFQVTAGRAGTQADVAGQRRQIPLTPFFFDVLHLDGTDLIDDPLSARHGALARVLPPELLIPRLVTGDLAAAEAFFADAVARGHEGVVVKSTSSLYAAGRRGSEWIKVKPRHTVDLVILAAEWGHGRRRGWLSNLHLGARDPATGGLVMLGKTFKGLTDEMLTWQTARLLELADPPGSRPAGDLKDAYGVLRVRPELVVEIAFDGVQTSPRYPGGLALRFARVLRHRPDKPAAEADTIDTIRALWPGASG